MESLPQQQSCLADTARGRQVADVFIEPVVDDAGASRFGRIPLVVRNWLECESLFPRWPLRRWAGRRFIGRRFVLNKPVLHLWPTLLRPPQCILDRVGSVVGPVALAVFL